MSVTIIFLDRRVSQFATTLSAYSLLLQFEGSGSLEQDGPLSIVAMKKRSKHASCIPTDLEKDNDMRTKRARH